MDDSELRAHLARGVVIPAHPLALTEARTLDERHQRALTRYYVDAGAGGVAVGVHTTQFAIRQHGLLKPVLTLARETARASTTSPFVMVAGAIGDTTQAVREASLAGELGYDATLLSLGAMKSASDSQLIVHCRAVAEVMPLFGFYLQPAVGGRVLSYSFWREFAEIPNVVAIKIAPFNRYQTLDVVRAVTDSGRADVALYTGNDDNIIADLLTPFPPRGRRIVGGLLGQWAVWTRAAVRLLERVKRGGADSSTALGMTAGADSSIAIGMTAELLRENAEVTDANSALFDAANNYAGCIAGIHEILRRQGLLRGIWCLDPNEGLSSGQREEIDRVCSAYPHLADDDFVRENLDRWLS